MSKVLVDRELLERTAAHLEWDGSEPMTTIQFAQKCDGLAGELRRSIAQPAEAEGIRHDTIVCWNCKENVTLEARDDEEGFCPHCMCELDLSDYLINANAALSAVTAERDRLLVDLERAHRATNSECMDWAREYERRKEVQAERDQLRAELEMLRDNNRKAAISDAAMAAKEA